MGKQEYVPVPSQLPLTVLPGPSGRWKMEAGYDHGAAHSHIQDPQPADSHHGSRSTKGEQIM